MSGPILNPNDKNFFSDENFASFDTVENQQVVDNDGNVVTPVTTAQYADWGPGPNEDESRVSRGRPIGDTSTLTFADEDGVL